MVTVTESWRNTLRNTRRIKLKFYFFCKLEGNLKKNTVLGCG